MRWRNYLAWLLALCAAVWAVCATAALARRVERLEWRQWYEPPAGGWKYRGGSGVVMQGSGVDRPIKDYTFKPEVK